jgi:hypothetical protein
MDNPTNFYEQLPTYLPDQVEQMLKAMHEDGFVLIKDVLKEKLTDCILLDGIRLVLLITIKMFSTVIRIG